MNLTQPINSPKPESMHIDDWINFAVCSDDKSLHYAAFVLDFAHRPAVYKFAFYKFMKNYKLFATYKGERYRVTGASRMGDVWLAVDHNRESGYDHRVDVMQLSDWSGES